MTEATGSSELVERLRGRARFCRDRREIKSPDVMEEAADRITDLEARLARADDAVERADTTDLKARLRAMKPGGRCSALPTALGLKPDPINPDGPEAADALDAKDRTIAGLREAFLETREFLSLLEPAVCDWSCPSKWRSGEPQPHSKLHHDLRDVLHKHETVAIALRDQRLARRMGAEFVPHDYDATPLKGQTP